MLKHQILIMLLPALLLSGCSNISEIFTDTAVDVQIVTEPATAELYLNGSRYTTRSTKQIHLDLTHEERQKGTYTLDIPEARWPSGTTLPQSRHTINLQEKMHQIVLRHPNPDSPAGQYDRVKIHTLKVYYKTPFPNAKIYSKGKKLGEAPIQKTYRITLNDYEKGSFELPAAEARWPSGTVNHQPASTLELNDTSLTHAVEFEHPDPYGPAGKFDRLKSHTFSVTYYSEPALALIFNTRKNYGRAPIKQNYIYTFEDYKKGFALISPMQARWTSGAQTNSGPIKVHLNHPEHDHTFIRPNVANINIDLETIYREEEKVRIAEAELKTRMLINQHQKKMEQLEKEKIQLEKDKLELLEKKQKALEKQNKELLRLKKMELEQQKKSDEQSGTKPQT